MRELDFYFDFISPYAYLASTKIEAIAARYQRRVRWHPFRLGITVVKVMGLRPLMQTPLKSDYITSDIRRLAQVLDVPLKRNGGLDDPLPPARLFYALPEEQAALLAKALLHACWAEGRDIADKAVLIELGEGCGVGEETVRAALSDQATRQRLNDATSAAMARGVFGSPTFVVGDELFWGVDRLWLLDHYLASGERYDPVAEQGQGMVA
ncbi:MAG: 2-hydroxychromene-2-carboxylate isomerase [Pseudomonadota bacterium]